MSRGRSSNRSTGHWRAMLPFHITTTTSGAPDSSSGSKKIVAKHPRGTLSRGASTNSLTSSASGPGRGARNRGLAGTRSCP
jgi:hypothetical protein